VTDNKKVLRFTTELPVALLAETLVGQADNDDMLVDLIKAIDDEAGYWQFTMRLADYFDDQRRIYQHEMSNRELETDSPDRAS
jgi:hypothetical protein